MAGLPLYSRNNGWYGDVVMNDGNDFSFLAEQPPPRGHPMEVSSSNGSASSARSTSTTATTASYMSSYANQHSPIHEPYNVSPSKAFGNLSLDNSTYYNSYPGLESHTYDQPLHNTPSSLGWNEQTRVAEFYDLVLEKSPKEHYLVLKTHLGEPPKPDNNFFMPPIVYLDHNVLVLLVFRSTRKLTVSRYGLQSDKKHHPCLYPGRGCWKDNQPRVFSRAADLERHYNIVHHASADKIKCDYPRCARHTDSFTRKDHCRDHYKEFHKEDMGTFKSPKTNVDKTTLQKKELQWKNERVITPDWWRCPKCLDRIYVESEGWQCKTCKRECEPHRIQARMNLLETYRESYGEDDALPTSSEQPQGYLPSCEQCQDSGYTTSYGRNETCYCQSLASSSSSYHHQDSWSQNQY